MMWNPHCGSFAYKSCFQLQIHSEKLENPLYLIENGKIEALEFPVDKMIGDMLELPTDLDVLRQSNTNDMSGDGSTDRNVPSQGLV